MSLDQAMKKLKFDARLVEQNISAGSITREEYEAHLKTLPDLGANATSLNMEDEKPDNDTH